jgi:hypothetical protein
MEECGGGIVRETVELILGSILGHEVVSGCWAAEAAMQIVGDGTQ